MRYLGWSAGSLYGQSIQCPHNEPADQFSCGFPWARGGFFPLKLEFAVAPRTCLNEFSETVYIPGSSMKPTRVK